jgi:hypothetical protein
VVAERAMDIDWEELGDFGALFLPAGASFRLDGAGV